MIEISSSLLAKIAGVLVAMLAVLAAYNGTTVQVAVNPVEPVFGAVPVLTSPQDWNGVTFINNKFAFKGGTSSVVSMPFTATTTPINVVCKGGGLSFAQEYEIAIGSTPNSTTTRSLGKLYVPASGTAMVIASTTGVTFNEQSKQWLVVKMATTSGVTVSTLLAPTGSCTFTGTTI